MKYLFTSLLGAFVFENNQLKDHLEFKNLADYQNREKFEQKLITKYKKLNPPQGQDLQFILSYFKEHKHLRQLYEKNLALTKRKIKESVNEDNLISQAICSLKELERISNILAKRLREWFELYLPEFSKSVTDHEIFIRIIQEKNRSQLLKELKLAESETMGHPLTKVDLDEILALAKQAANVIQLRKKQLQYLEKIMQKYCPNLLEMCGALIGASLLETAGSLKRLATLSSSTVQLLGAEKALFRHIRTGAKSPKYGFIHKHPFIQKAQEKGKAARALADKISLAARLDFFKGEFKAKQMLKDLEAKFR